MQKRLGVIRENNMTSHYYTKNGFPMVRVEEVASKFMTTLESLINYDDGQGRSYDILDEEINE